jgi:16S rRNA (adenine1518-N6/adenine1519-N6)-dimethyltransferase
MKQRLIPRKCLGQHFLMDVAIIEHIVSLIDPKPADNLVEIGPGIGALTVPILKKAQKMSAIELDCNLVPMLKEACRDEGELSIYTENVLSFDFAQLIKPSQPMRILGNLPYNISTPLLFYLLNYAKHIQDMHLMLQKEVVERLAAPPNSSSYGRLSVMIQYQCAVTPLLLVPSEAFFPPPKVESAVVRLVPHAKLPYKAVDLPLFEDLVRQAFGMRRKTLRNALKKLVTPEIWEIVGIDSRLRPEVLSVKDYVELSNAIFNHPST